MYGKLFSDQNWKKLNMELYTMHMVTILSIPILRITIVREPQLSAGFAGKSRNRGTLMFGPYGMLDVYGAAAQLSSHLV